MVFNIVWQELVKPEIFRMREVASTMEPLPKELEKAIENEFAVRKAKNPKFYDGPLWRYEGVRVLPSTSVLAKPLYVVLDLSRTTYLKHNVLRDLPGRDFGRLEPRNIQYPNPASINAVPVSSDGFITVGVKGGISDQAGVGAIGGFIKHLPGKEDKPTIIEPLSDTIIRETLEETTLKNENINKDDARVMGAIYGSNKDTTFASYLPLNIRSDEYYLKPNEHAATMKIPFTEKRMGRFLDGDIEGAMSSIVWDNTIQKHKDAEHNYNQKRLNLKPVDHCYGDVKLLLTNRLDGKI